MSCCSSALAAACSSGSACSPPPLGPSLSHRFGLLDRAAEHMMVHRDFQAALDTCDRGLQRLGSAEQEDGRCRHGELKAGFSILGIQALAELNQWRRVLPWVLQQYERGHKVPAKIMQMCILLYSKVGEPAVMQDAAGAWLRCPLNSRATGYGTVAELYLLHVLVPLGLRHQAVELIVGEVGSSAFTEDQKQAALDVVEEREQQDQESSSHPRTGPNSESPACPVSPPGAVVQKLGAVLRFLCGQLRFSSFSFSLRRAFLAALILYMLFLRLDPALPSAFMWISKLLELLRQTWREMFAPYHQAHSRGL